MNTFTAQDMKDYGRYVANLDSAMLSPNFEKWCKERFEPTKKVIDLSVLIESGIDCEFSNSDRFDLAIRRSLVGILRNGNLECEMGTIWKYCRPRMNHTHAWQGGECPLPEGLLMAFWFRGDSYMITTNYMIMSWTNEGEASGIIAFEVLGLADGYVMPWESES